MYMHTIACNYMHAYDRASANVTSADRSVGDSLFISSSLNHITETVKQLQVLAIELDAFN